MKTLNRRTFLVSLGAGASVGYLTPIHSFAQSSRFSLSRDDYITIQQTKVQLRIAYSNFCLSPSDYIENLSAEISQTQERMNRIVALDYVQLPDLVEEEPWTLTNLPPTAIELVRQVNGTESEVPEEISYDPCTEVIIRIISDLIGIEPQELKQLTKILDEAIEIGVELTNSLEQIAHSIIDLDFNRAKTHVEIIANTLISEETYELISETMQHNAFQAIISFIEDKKVPLLDLYLVIASLLKSLYEHREEVYSCISDD